MTLPRKIRSKLAWVLGWTGAIWMVAIFAAKAQAMWAPMPAPVPVERLAKNLERFVKAHPDLPHGYFALGRVYSLAFCLKTDALKVQTAGDGEKPRLVRFHERISLTGKDAAEGDVEETPAKSILVSELEDKDLRQYLVKSVENFRKAADRAPDKQVIPLGKGWVLEQGAAFAAKEGLAPPEAKVTEKLSDEERAGYEALTAKLGAEDFETRQGASDKLAKEINKAWPVLVEHRKSKDAEIGNRVHELLAAPWREEALNAYRKAFELALKHKPKDEEDQKAEEEEDLDKIPEDYLEPSMFWSSVAPEAGQGIVRLLELRTRTEKEQKEWAETRKKLEKMPSGPRAITPLILPLEGDAKLDELLAPDRRAVFDLDGDGKKEDWSWITPRAGLLVWDPEATGRVESGIQLFGNATWWIFWKNGYQALSMLDDDGDGWLSGEELKGLAVWQDVNGNGVSDPGEVQPLGFWKIARLRVEPAGRIRGMPFHPRGLQRTDGSYATTYDWISKR
jgi:hypothetical protein